MKIIEIKFNWFQTGDRESGFGEDYHWATVGKKLDFDGPIVTKIEEYRPLGTSNPISYSIHLEGGNVLQVFNPNTILWEK
ncbi:MAG: hypothetical protein V3V84_08875 [Candidatus Bathyarchaeia archaeon]